MHHALTPSVLLSHSESPILYERDNIQKPNLIALFLFAIIWPANILELEFSLPQLPKGVTFFVPVPLSLKAVCYLAFYFVTLKGVTFPDHKKNKLPTDYYPPIYFSYWLLK